jgi:hypothetical protein
VLPRPGISDAIIVSVPITDHTRRVLWARAGNACALCHAALVRAPERGLDRHTVVGQECRIVARRPGGPRGNAKQRANIDIDGYSNLVLMCANCHALIDAQTELYTVDELQRHKAAHETRAASFPRVPDLR